MIKPTRYDPSKNMHRFYALQLAPTLFGEWVLVAEWGRIGSPGTVQQNVFHSTDLAQAAFTKRQNDKIRRGYRPLESAWRRIWNILPRVTSTCTATRTISREETELASGSQTWS